jgi:prolyl oligopeptidase PreP (S9A serine peptidase family)
MKLKSCLTRKKKSSKSSIETVLKPSIGSKKNSLTTLYSSQTYHSLGQLWNGYEYKDTSFLIPSSRSSTDTLIDNTHNFGKNRKKYPSVISWATKKKQLTENLQSWNSKHFYKHHLLEHKGHDEVKVNDVPDICIKRNLNGKLNFHESSSNETRIDIEKLFQNLNVLHQFTNGRHDR